MSEFKNWLIMIIGVVFIGAIIELIMPQKRMSKIINFTISIIMISTMFPPLINLVNEYKFTNNLDWIYLTENNNEYYASIINNLENQVERKIKSNLNVICNVKIEYKLNKDEIEYTVVKVNLPNDNEEIDKKQIELIIQSLITISSKGIVFYE